MKIKNKKKIIALSIAILVAVIMLTTVEAAVTRLDGTTASLVTTQTTGEKIADEVLNVLGRIGEFAISGVLSFITPLISGLTIVIVLTLYVLFATGFGEHVPPMPDNLVFNKIPALDANFVNPHNNSILKLVGGDFLADLFMSFQTIAIAVFIVAAMVTGLKIALSTIAAKRAQYKQVAMKWLTGFIILICLRWILAGIFLINETLVAQFASIAKSGDFSIRVTPTVPLPIIGRLISDAIKGITAAINGESGIPVPGYLGLILYSIFQGWTGDIVASIVGFVIVGQASVVLGSYIKRMFMCLLLGVISPLIVATDTIVAVSGGQSQVFKTWLKNFIFTVFTQSFHAAYMVIVFKLMNNITGKSLEISSMLVSILVVTLTTGLVKMEKMLKGMFGFGDSLGGSLADGKKSMKKAMGAVAGLAAAAKALGDNKPKQDAARKKVQAYSAEKERLKASLREGGGKGNSQTSVKGGTTNIHNNGNIVTNGVGNAAGGGNSSSAGGSGKNMNSKEYLQSVLDGNSKPLTVQEKIDLLTQAEAQARSEEKSARFAKIMGPANLAAGIGIGIGMDDDIGDALFKGGMITSGLDRLSEGVGRRAADKDRETLYAKEKRDGDELNYKVSDTRREKSTVEAALTLDVAKLSADLKKEFRGLGEVFGNQVRREIREIDKDLDNER